MANSPSPGGGKRTGNNGHSVLDCFSQNDMPLGGTSQERRDMSGSSYGQYPNSGQKAKATHIFKSLIKLSL